jgi:hypothetical protein
MRRPGRTPTAQGSSAPGNPGPLPRRPGTFPPSTPAAFAAYCGRGTTPLPIPMQNAAQGQKTHPDIAAFDFDGTLTTKDSFLRFLAWRRPRTRLAADLIVTSPLLALYAARIVGNEAHKMSMFALRFGGMKSTEFNSMSLEFSLQELPQLIGCCTTRAWGIASSSSQRPWAAG